MRRSSPLRREKSLTAKTPLKRTVALGRSPLARSVLHAGLAARNATKRRDTGPSAKVRELVHVRSGGWCEWAGCWLVASQIHHRRPRRMGGSTDPVSNRPSNLLDLCSADHEYAESHRAEALERGVLLHASVDPRAVPVLSRHGLVWLADDGAVLTTNPYAEEATMTMGDTPLPDMPNLPTLWAVHVQGPDDIIATADRDEAQKHADAINAWYERQTKRPDFDAETFPRVHAEVIEWPYDRSGHAEDLARGDVRWAA